jgi:Tol biopolymer transport system component
VAYSSNLSGGPEVYVQRLDGGSATRISRDGGTRPRWRRDGREIFYVSRDNEMIATPIRLTSEAEIGAPQRLFRLDPAGWQDYDVTGDGERFLAVVNVPAPDADAITVTVNWPSLLKH